MTPGNRQIVGINGKADEWVNTGVIEDGTGETERIAKDVLDTRKKVYAAIQYAVTFQDEIEEPMIVEEISKEDNYKSNCFFWLSRNWSS